MDDITSYIAADNIDDIIKKSEEASTALFQWFDNNLLKRNPGKCHLPRNSDENITTKIGEYEIEDSECEILLGVKLSWKLDFDDYIGNVSKKACRNLNALVRIGRFIGLSKRRVLLTPFLIFSLVILSLFECAKAA